MCLVRAKHARKEKSPSYGDLSHYYMVEGVRAEVKFASPADWKLGRELSLQAIAQGLEGLLEQWSWLVYSLDTADGEAGVDKA
jgi:hypothetical protein